MKQHINPTTYNCKTLHNDKKINLTTNRSLKETLRKIFKFAETYRSLVKKEKIFDKVLI